MILIFLRTGTSYWLNCQILSLAQHRNCLPHNKHLRNGTFPAIFVNKGCDSQKQLQLLPMMSWWAWRNSGKKKNLPSSSHSTVAAPHGKPWGNSGCENRILAPDSWDAYQRNYFSEPRLLHLPIHSKAINSLNWNIWFPLIINNLLMFRLPAPHCKTSV